MAGISYLTPDALKTVIVSFDGSDISPGSTDDNVDAIASIPSHEDDVGVLTVGGGTGVLELKTGEDTALWMPDLSPPSDASFNRSASSRLTDTV
jgi:hypothetical protein